MSGDGGEPGTGTPPILDLRPGADFVAGHLRGAVSLPLEERDDWPSAGRLTSAYLADALPSYLLPPDYVPLVVVATALPTARRVCALLTERGRRDLTARALPPAAVAALPAATVTSGPNDHHLWRPPPFLAAWARLLPPPAAGGVLDLACGSGRAAVWLARRGYRVTGVDRLPGALERGRRLAADSEVHCRFVVADLRDPAQVPSGPWAVILMLRYLQRDLLAELGGRLGPHGVAVVRTFRDVAGFAGKPGRRHRLDPAELPRYFPSPRFTLLVCEENHDPDGRPAAGVVARRDGLLQ